MNLPELFSQYQNLELVLESLPDAIMVHDLERRITFFNRAAERLTGLTKDEAIGRDCHEILGPALCGAHCAFCTGACGGVRHDSFPVTVMDRDGGPHQAEMTVVPMHGPDGAIVGVLAAARDVTEVTELRRAMGRERGFRGLVGQHHLMQQVYELVREVARTDAPVLIQGESGTGKELVASAIHGESDRAALPFVAVNCGAVPEGLQESELFGHERGAFTGAVRAHAGHVERANRGTLFLDEIGELSPAMQVKLLRVLESQRFERVGGERTVEVDVRIVSATHRDLRADVAAGRFRQDLYYRIAVVPIPLPPLRERRTDLPLLAEHLLERFASAAGRPVPRLDETALRLLLDYPWPGNVRELTNALQYALVKTRGPVIRAEHLPPELGAPVVRAARSAAGRKPKLTVAQVTAALEQTGGNRVEAARLLGVGRATLYRYL